jgi:membrane protein YdbS with pleckstrin-like domain
MKFKSAISLMLVVPVFMLIGFTTALMAREGVWPGVIVNALGIAFMVHAYFTTYYELEEDALHIQCSFFYSLRIPYTSIRKVKYTSNPLSSPAFSLKRLQIDYGKMSSVMISPHTREAFLEALRPLTEAEFHVH